MNGVADHVCWPLRAFRGLGHLRSGYRIDSRYAADVSLTGSTELRHYLPARSVRRVLFPRFVGREVLLVLVEVLGVAIVVRFVERGSVPGKVRMLRLQLVGPFLETPVFVLFGFGHRVLQ
jgi:hypothetical protein